MGAEVPLKLNSRTQEGLQTGDPDELSGYGVPVPVSVVMPTLNEGPRIHDAVSELEWADEVIVVDGGSADDTVAQAEVAGAAVLVSVGETIAAQRNAGIAAAKNHWVLALDADERVTSQLRAEIARVVGDTDVGTCAYRIKFRNYYLGRELRHGPWGRDAHVRLFTRERRFVCRRVHEHVESTDDAGTLAGSILHYPYRDLGHHARKIVQYARWGADDLYAQGRRATAWDLVSHPAWRFVRDFLLFSGWRDGVPGFIAAIMSSFAAFLKYGMLYAESHSRNS